MTAQPLRFCLFVLFCTVAFAAPANTPKEAGGSRRIEFPDVPGFMTIVSDLHLHTVFSDGEVWPTIRVQEAVRDGLDAIAITDHLEYQPHRADIPHPDRNRSFEIAAKAAEKTPLLVLRGAEVTRDMPPGHVNGIFLTDANALLREEPLQALQAAAQQGAFLFWNHPSWVQQKPDGVAQLTPMHERLIKEGVIQGIEVVNETEYSDESLQIALDHNLTIMGNSDIHGFIDWKYRVPTGHRPVTLIFAKEKTAASLKEALIARRTVVWFNNTLIGRAEWIDPLLAASLTATLADYRGSTTVLDVNLANGCDADLVLRNTGAYRFYDSADTLIVKAHSALTIGVKTVTRLPRVELAFEVMNAVTAPGTHASLTFALEPTPSK